jgi:hypothetical protein
MNWKFTDAGRSVAFRTNDAGGMESVLASALPAGTVVDDPDPDTTWRDYIMEDFRVRREVYLTRLAGIAVFEGSGDGLVKDAASTFRQRLLDIPADPTVTGATSATMLNAAIYKLYKAAVSEAKTTAPNASTVFDKVSK